MAFWDWSTADSEKDCTPPGPDASTFFLSDPWYVVFWAACWHLFNQSDLLKSAVDFRTYNIRYLPILTCATSYRQSVRLFTQLACQPTITWQAKYSNLKGLVNSSITVKQKSRRSDQGYMTPALCWRQRTGLIRSGKRRSDQGKFSGLQPSAASYTVTFGPRTLVIITIRPGADFLPRPGKYWQNRPNRPRHYR